VNLKVIVEEHADGFVGYPVGLKGVIVAEGDTYDEAVANVQSAIQFHIETFGLEALDNDDTVIQVFLADMAIAA
jgi:predicted RNase H-like HicB family nuclease